MRRLMSCVALVLLLSPLMSFAQAPAKEGAPKPLATRELDVEGIVAEVIESNRKDGMLMVRVRFRNVGTEPVRLSLARGGVSYHTQNYIVAGDTRYEIMRDTAGNVLATPRDGGGWLEPTLKPKGTFTWWAQYAAPPAALKNYTLYLKVGPPIDGVPINDR